MSLSSIVPSFDHFRAFCEIAAVVLGVVAYRDLKRQLTASSALATSLTALSGSLSTRFEGHFPNHLELVTEMLGRTKDAARIMNDFADYGSFTAHALFFEYKRALERLAADRKNVSMLVYSFDEAKRRTTEEFGTVEALKSYEGSKPFSEYLARKNLKTAEPHELVDLMLDDQCFFEKELVRTGMGLKYSRNDSFPLFCWIRDDVEAVFCFQFPGGIQAGESFRSSEIAFYTRDTQLVQTLIRLFDDRYCEGLPPAHESAAGT
jgi:hypothetical protein